MQYITYLLITCYNDKMQKRTGRLHHITKKLNYLFLNTYNNLLIYHVTFKLLSFLFKFVSNKYLMFLKLFINNTFVLIK